MRSIGALTGDRPARGATGITLFVLVAAACLAVAAAPAQAALPDPGTPMMWSFVSGPLDRDDAYYDVTVGGTEGYLYAAGCSDRDVGSYHGYLLMGRYVTGSSPAIWTRAWLPMGATEASASAVTADSAGNVVAVGQAWNGADWDIVVIKRDLSGTIIWADVKGGAAHANDAATDVVADGAGNVYVCGTLDDSAKAVVLKYAADPDPDGFMTADLLWEKATRPTVTPGSTEAWGLACADGAVYFTGARTTKNGADCFLRKLGRDGSTKWLRGWDGAAHRYDCGQALEVFRTPGPDAVYVAGGTETKRHGWDVLLLKYSTAGKRLWARTYDGPTHGSDEVWDMAVDGRGRARVVGSSFQSATSVTKAMLLGWSADGNRRWARTYRVATGQQAAFASVTAGNSAIWVAGHADTATRRDWVVARYAADGTRTWLTRWPGPAADPRGGSAYACATYGTTGLFVGGAVRTAAEGDDAVVVWFRR